MKKETPSRRDFHQLTLAALGGALAGSVIGCSSGDEKGAGVVPNKVTGGGATDGGAGGTTETSLLLAEPHVCRGLNACAGKGGCGETKGKNDCAGLGACATAAHHSCAEANECKGQGGCGATTGINECKGKGGCEVPLMEGAWTKARAQFEELLTAQDKKFGAAPAAK